MKEKEMEISQKRFFSGKRHITIDDNKITVKIEKFGSKNEYSFDLEIISEHSSHIKKISHDWLGAFLVVGFIDILFFIGLFHAKNDGKMVFVTFVVIFTLFWIICLAKLWLNSVDSLLFFNKFNGHVVFELLYNRPNQAEFSTFTEFLIKKLAVSSEQQKNSKKTFSSELLEIVKLKEEGLLDEHEFKILKEGLINKTAEAGKIGF